MNVIDEILEHIEGRKVKYIQVKYCPCSKREPGIEVSGVLSEVLPELNFEYDNGYGSRELYGTIWYEDGTWSERCEYDGSEWWEHKQCPELPAEAEN